MNQIILREDTIRSANEIYTRAAMRCPLFFPTRQIRVSLKEVRPLRHLPERTPHLRVNLAST